MTGNRQWPDYRVLPEPELVFDPLDGTKRSTHPLEGLLTFGPYGQHLGGTVPNTIRVGLIAPASDAGAIPRLISQLGAAHRPTIRTDYLPRFPGFTNLFHAGLAVAEPAGRIELSRDLDASLAVARRPHAVLAEALGTAVRAIALQRHAFDVVAIYLPDRWAAGFEGPPDEKFDLHDFLKGILAPHGIPSQLVREDTAGRKPDHCGVMWSLGIAFYAKAGGVPWKLYASDDSAAHIGLAYSLARNPDGSVRFVVCCSQVFDTDGTGLEFLAYQAQPDRVRVVGRNPYLDREPMRAVIARSIALYLNRKAGRMPRKMVVHKTTRFTPQEADGCYDALSKVDHIELVQVQEDAPWRAVVVDFEGRSSSLAPSAYPLKRGTLMHLGDYDLLLWTQGTTALAGRSTNYYKEGTGIPRPIMLKRWGGAAPAGEVAGDVLGLTKMNWNNDALYDFAPCTIRYSQVLAQVVKTMPGITAQPYPVRLFM